MDPDIIHSCPTLGRTGQIKLHDQSFCLYRNAVFSPQAESPVKKSSSPKLGCVSELVSDSQYTRVGRKEELKEEKSAARKNSRPLRKAGGERVHGVNRRVLA